MRKVHDGKIKVILKMVMFVCIAVFVLVHPLSASADVIFERKIISTKDIVTSARILIDLALRERIHICGMLRIW